MTALKVNFAVLQEVAKPAVESTNELWVGTMPKQGLSVVSFTGAPLHRAADYDESLLFALPVEVGGKHPFQILAIWMARAPVHYVPNLVAILDRYQGFIRRAPTVIAGDFNANPVFDQKHRRYLFASITDKMSAAGLSSSYHAFTGEPFGRETQPTYYHTYKREKPFHIDYLFTPDSWRAAMRSATVGEYDDYQTLSDHRPLTVSWS